MCLNTKKRTTNYEPKGRGHSANLTCRHRIDYTEVSNELQIKKSSNATSHYAVALSYWYHELRTLTRRASRTPQTVVPQITRGVFSRCARCASRRTPYVNKFILNMCSRIHYLVARASCSTGLGYWPPARQSSGGVATFQPPDRRLLQHFLCG